MIGCFEGLIITPDKIALSVLSLGLAVAALLAIKKFNLSPKIKVGLIYAHLITLLFPFVLLTTNFACGAVCSMYCYNDTTSNIAYALPTTLLLGTLAGFVVIPGFYMFSNRKTTGREINSFVKKYSKKLRIKTPNIYLIDKAKPIAFSFRSFRSAIFISVGMLDVLNKKELQAVLLHELSHIKQKSSLLKVSFSLLRLSPMSILGRFHHDTGKEERAADEFAARIQGTSRYVNSAKKKIADLD
ncbi:MAG TPA: M56 family metallopeptidase [archaeon]|nr:M56 family metallopeptidase [archaeon]